MNRLRDHHKRFIYTVFALTASFYFFLLLKIPLSKETLDDLGWFGISWSVVAAIIVFLYERWGWWLFNPKFDFVGIWTFTESQYRFDDAGHQPVFDYDAKGNVRVVQDLRSICLIEGQTYKAMHATATNLSELNKTADWWSVACELDDNGTRIDAALYHKSLVAAGNDTEYGVEVFRVTKRNKSGRPIKMSSTVYHCIGSGKPHQIDVSYTRDGF